MILKENPRSGNTKRKSSQIYWRPQLIHRG